MVEHPPSSVSEPPAELASVAVDVRASCLLIHTRATGLLARFAHNLELEASALEVDLRSDGERWVAELRAPVRAVRVVGVHERRARGQERAVARRR